jgi:hypothetical protein
LRGVRQLEVLFTRHALPVTLCKRYAMPLNAACLVLLPLRAFPSHAGPNS